VTETLKEWWERKKQREEQERRAREQQREEEEQEHQQQHQQRKRREEDDAQIRRDSHRDSDPKPSTPIIPSYDPPAATNDPSPSGGPPSE